MPTWKLVILESPYAADTHDGIRNNLWYARRCIRDCLLRGEAAIASHLLYTQPGILRDKNPEERKLGISAGHAWLWAIDHQVFYTDRGWSPGMLQALRTFLNSWENSTPTDYSIRIRSLDGTPTLPPLDDPAVADYLTRFLEVASPPQPEPSHV